MDDGASPADLIPVRRALISVSDKTGVVEFARFLAGRGVEIFSTGGTARMLGEHNIAVTEVSAYTGFPEIMDGRVKTLHPKIHAGLLGRRELDAAAMSEHGIEPIDLLAVNLYPFERTVSKAGVTREEAVEQIDVGGPAMMRAGAKNHDRVAVVADPADYTAVMQALRSANGTTRALRSRLAVKAFRRTAAYDAAIAAWLAGVPDVAEAGDGDDWPPSLTLNLKCVQALLYGENPHQRAAFYVEDGVVSGGFAGAGQLQGKPLSYNNIADVGVAYECVRGFKTPACVIVKHANPCGVACAASPHEAYRRALESDSMSAFGGIIAFNRALDAPTAREIVGRQFVEAIIVPEVLPGALDALREKEALRVLACGEAGAGSDSGRRYVSAFGGVLVQDGDVGGVGADVLEVRTRRRPGDDEVEALLFAWRVVKFVKSNAIVFARGLKDGAVTVGVGGGQTSRGDSVQIAARKSRESKLGGEIGAGRPLVMASDAFFPFRDGLDVAAGAGVAAVIQPGGSIHDDEVIAAADEHGLAMVFTGVRHFRH